MKYDRLFDPRDECDEWEEKQVGGITRYVVAFACKQPLENVMELQLTSIQ